MAKNKTKQIEVILVETFKGAKLLIRTDKPYEQELLGLFRGLIDKYPLGSIAHISKRVIDEKKYLEQTTKAKVVDGEIQTESRMTYTKGNTDG